MEVKFLKSIEIWIDKNARKGNLKFWNYYSSLELPYDMEKLEKKEKSKKKAFKLQTLKGESERYYSGLKSWYLVEECVFHYR